MDTFIHLRIKKQSKQIKYLGKNMAQREKPTTVYWIEDKLYLNITNKCTNNCFFCLRNFKRGVSGFNLKLSKDPTIEEIISDLSDVLYMRNWTEIVFCGFGEPISRLDGLIEVTKWIHSKYSRPVKLRINSNGHGYKLNPSRNVVAELKEAGIDKVSVSLNAGDLETYNEVCKPTFDKAYETMLEFIRRTKDVIDVEVTAIRMPEVDIQKVEAVAQKLGVKLRIREYIPCFY